MVYAPGGEQAEAKFEDFFRMIEADVMPLAKKMGLTFLIHVSIPNTNFAATHSNALRSELVQFAEICAGRLRERIGEEPGEQRP